MFGRLLIAFSHSYYLFLPVWTTFEKTHSLKTYSPLLKFQANNQKLLQTPFFDSTSHFTFSPQFLSHSYPFVYVTSGSLFFHHTTQTRDERRGSHKSHSSISYLCLQFSMVGLDFWSAFLLHENEMVLKKRKGKREMCAEIWKLGWKRERFLIWGVEEISRGFGWKIDIFFWFDI